MRRNSLIQLSSFASGRTSRRPIGVLNGLLVCAAVLIASGCTPDPVKPKPDPKPGATNATDPDEPEEGPGETAPDGRPPAPKGVAAGGAGSVSAAYGIGSTARATVLRVQPSERNAELARELIDRVFDQQVPPDPVDLAYRMANLGPQAFDLLVARANSRTLRKPDVVLLMKIFANVELDIEQSALMRLMDRESEAAAIFRRRLLEISDADTLEALLGLIFRSPSPSLAQLPERHTSEYRFRNTVAFWIAISFVEGSLLFLCGAVVSMCALGDEWMRRGLVEYAYFAGSLFFSLGAYLGFFQVINVGNATTRLVGCRGTSVEAYWGSLLYFLGALCFNESRMSSIP